MNQKKTTKLLKINQVVAECGEIMVSPTATEEMKADAVARVDALGDPGASHAIRTYGDTVGLDPVGSEGADQFQELVRLAQEEEAQRERVAAMRVFAKQ